MAAIRSKLPWGEAPEIIDPWARLAGAIMLSAVREARRGDVGACEWLATSDQAALFCDSLGLDPAAIESKARSWASDPAGAIIIKVVAEV